MCLMFHVKYLLPLLFPTLLLAQATAQSDVDPVLDRLDAAGKNLKSFASDVKVADSDPDTGDATAHLGKVWYALDPAGNPRIHVQYTQRQVNDNKPKPDKVDYVLAGTDLIDRNDRLKTENTHHVLRPGEKLDLFKLGSGPFPLPIGQSKQDVHAAFDIAPVAPAADDPANTDHLQLTPKPGTRLARDFKSIDVWADKGTGMPARIVTRRARGDAATITDLTNIQLNLPIGDQAFVLPKIDPKDWQLMEDEYQR